MRNISSNSDIRYKDSACKEIGLIFTNSASDYNGFCIRIKNKGFKMADGNRYMPQTKVEWTSNNAYKQFRMWKEEVERIIDGPMAKDSDSVKLNTVYIWAGAYAETLVEARQAEDPTLKIEKVACLLDCLSQCLTHKTFFREAREDFYNIKQRPEENTTMYYSRIIELYKLGEFPADSNFLIVDKLIHGCTNAECKRKLMARGNDVNLKTCLEVL